MPFFLKPIDKTAQKQSATIFVVSPQDFSKVQKTKLPVLLEVHADWCVLSQKMNSTLNTLAQTFHKKIRFAKILIDSFEDQDPIIQFLKKTYNLTISWVPTLLYIKDGKIIEVLKEGIDTAALTKKLNTLLKTI